MEKDIERPASPPPRAAAAPPAPQQRSTFREMASVAGGVAVGSAVGHAAGEAITGMFSGRRREEVQQVLPQNYQLGQEPTGPCAWEIKQFLKCAEEQEELEVCSNTRESLRICKERNRIV